MSILAMVLGFTLGIGVATAAPTGDAAVAGRIAKEFVIPRYETLEKAAAEEREAWKTFCTKPSDAGLKTLRQAYLAAADAWSGIEFIRYGPVSVDFRIERISYWPERKNATARGLATLLAKTGTDGLEPSTFRQASAAVQGLPALERLLYGDPLPGPDAFAGSPEADRKCAVGTAIAANVAGIATEVTEEWKGPLAAELSDPIKAREAVQRIATDLLTSFQLLRDQKVLPVLGADAGNAKPKLAEGWRSGRPTRALRINLQSIEALTKLIMSTGDVEEPSVLYNIASTRRMADGLPDDFAALAADPKERQRVILLLDALGFARDRAAIEVPQVLGITLGFNSLDGD